MAKERKQAGGEKVIAFRVSEPTFQALERLKRRHARSWSELTLKAIAKAFGEVSEEDAADCHQVETELQGEAPAEPLQPAAETAETSAESAIATEEVIAEEAPVQEAGEEASDDQLQKLRAPVVICKGCQQRMNKGTLVVKRADGYYHPSCVLRNSDVTH
ncbi:hypothetical protein M1N21_00345 [Dehalococcoidia bacterium]|nr:hypothetical protein [Dehalococcoidia bacterium]